MNLPRPFRTAGRRLVSLASALPPAARITLAAIPALIGIWLLIQHRGDGHHSALRRSVIPWMALSTPAFLVALLRWKIKIPAAAFGLAFLGIATLWISWDIHQHWEQALQSFAGEVPAFGAYIGKLLLLAVLFLVPPLFIAYYRHGSILDRYLIRNTLGPLLFCLFGLIAIWLIIDLSDKLEDFIEAKTPLRKIAQFYFILVPLMVAEILPVTLLLSLLYALGRMSRSNELVSMFGTGRSVLRVLTPCFAIGIAASVILLAISYYWAPRADGHKDTLLEALTEGKAETLAHRQLYRNREALRTWYIATIPYDSNRLDRVWVVEQHPDGRLHRSLIARYADWSKETGKWTLTRGKEVVYNQDGLPTPPRFFDKEPNDTMLMENWPETPWQIFSSTLKPQHLSIPELSSYLKTNQDFPDDTTAPYKTFWHYRFANPWSCLVVVLIATPIGVVSSRRGLLGGVAAAVFIFFAIFFSDNLFLALCQGNRLNPLLGTWMTNILFGGIGTFLLHRRMQNRDLPKFGLGFVGRLLRPSPS